MTPPLAAQCKPFILAALMLTCTAAFADEKSPTPNRLKVGIVQLALADTVAENRDRIVGRIAEAAARGVRVVVFPEGAVRGKGDDDSAIVEDALQAIRRAASESNVYVLTGGKTWSTQVKKVANWMYVIDPSGRDLLRYEKLYDNNRAAMPGVFYIDGIPCNAMICADRWLRGVEEVPIQQGAQISFELSNNYGCEWVSPFEWYWNVSRALRNDVWVLFANSCNQQGIQSLPVQSCHGHSAIIAPDGRVVAASRDNSETIVVAELDLTQATRAAAQARFTHPALKPFWEAGSKLQRGETVEAPPITQLTSPATEITIAAAQMTGDLEKMLSMISEARAKHADVVVFPARAIDESALKPLQAAAREHNLVVVVGMEHRADSGRFNSAFVIGPDGKLLTRYDQLSATSPHQAGVDPKSMWFRVKGVPAVVTIEQDAQWTELAELAAVAGAQIHVHLDHDPDSSSDAELRRKQVWANLLSFHTFSASVNVTGSALWEDLHDRAERKLALWQENRNIRPGDTQPVVPDNGPLVVDSAFSTNLIVHAGTGLKLLVATRQVNPTNVHYPFRTKFNPQMDAWYRLGAAIVGPPWKP